VVAHSIVCLEIMEKVKLYKTEEWHEDFGDCVFFNFINFKEPPTVICTCPLSSDFMATGGEMTWTHFIKLDFNDIFDQAQGKIKECKHYYLTREKGNQWCVQCLEIVVE